MVSSKVYDKVFWCATTTITKHLKNIFERDELEDGTVSSIWNILLKMVKIIRQSIVT